MQLNRVDPRFFETMKIPLLRGRNLKHGDTHVAVISESMARMAWPGQDALGKSFTLGQPITVVGICGHSVARVLSCFASRMAALTEVRIEVIAAVIFVEFDADVGGGGIIGLDREIARTEMGRGEMFAVGQRVPTEEILRAFRHVRNHLQQHDGFVKMI